MQKVLISRKHINSKYIYIYTIYFLMNLKKEKEKTGR